MALVRWAPARELYPMQSEITRLFNTLFDTATPLSESGGSRRFVPATDIVENEHEYVLRTDLPGVSESDVKLEVLEGVLTISGERKREQKETTDGYRRIERYAGSFSRSVTLPKGVDAAAVQASFSNGVLEVHVPKPEDVKPHAVQISVGDRLGDAEEPATFEAPESVTPAAA